jgi:hypothetical protein
MFGKRKQDHKHRYAEEGLGDLPEDDARLAPDDPELAAALLQLGRNAHAPLPEPPPVEVNEMGAPNELDEPKDMDARSKSDEPKDMGAPNELDEPKDMDARSKSDEPSPQDGSHKSVGVPAPNGPARAAVPTAADLAEPEPDPDSEVVRPEPSSVGEVATYSALRRERAKVAEQEAALRSATDEVASLKAELKQVRVAAAGTQPADVQGPTARTDELEQSLKESQGRIDELTAEVDRLQSTDSDEQVKELRSKVSALTAELERSRSEAAASGVALERVEREVKDQERTVAAAEERAEQLAAEIKQLRAEAAKGPAQVERLRREAEREKALRAALEQAQATHAQAEAALADNHQLASNLAANLQSQEGLITALIGLQAEVTEQRAWFEAQLANLREMESQQTSVVDTLQAAIQDRDLELELVRQQLLEAEAKRAEEAAAFVAALEGQ